MNDHLRVDVKAFIDQRSLSSTGLNAFAPGCYPTVARATGVSWMLGMGRFGSILGPAIGGVLRSMGWGFTAVISLLAIPALAAGFAALRARAAAAAPPIAEARLVRT